VIVRTNHLANGCEISSTNRVPASEPGLFTLELEVKQSVQASTTDLTLLTPLIETGFSRGRGGRASFRDLLIANDEFFGDLEDVDILLDGSFTPPATESPTTSPSSSPTFGPSLVPTTAMPNPSPTPFPPPTVAPTTAMPTPSPTPFPPPTVAPTTAMPTPSPTPFPSPTIVPTMAVKTPSPAPFPSLSPTITSPPAAPSLPESSSPTIHQIGVPSLSPTLLPSIVLSQPPSVSHQVFIATPSATPSVTPSQQVEPVVEPSQEPSKGPSNQPSAKKEVTIGITDPGDKSNDVKLHPAVIAAIVGGALAVAIFCCFALRCFCCGRKSKNEEREDTSQKGIETSPALLPVIPEVVQLDDGNQSLADTTLGEHTAGRKPPKKKRIVALDSFDESSIYTSTYKIRPATQIQDEPSHMHRSSVHITSILAGDGGSSVEPSTLGSLRATSRGTSFAESDPNQSDTTETPSLDFATDFGDDPFFGEEEGLLGAIAPSSPLANRIENMVADELDDSYSDSSSCSTGIVIGFPDMDSPLDLLRQRESNVVIVEDDTESTGEFPLDGGSRDGKKLDFETISSDDSEIISLSTRSSMTSKIGNITPSCYDDAKSKNTASSESLSAKNLDGPSASSRRGGSNLLREQVPPSALHQTKFANAYQPKTNTSPVYRSQYLGMSLDKDKQSAQHFVPKSDEKYRSPSEDGEVYVSPLASSKTIESSSPRTPTIENNVTGGNVSPAKTLREASSQDSSGQTTPQTLNEAGPKTPAGIRRVTALTNNPFRSPASLKTVKPKKTHKPQTPISPGGSSSSDSDEENAFLFGAVERTLGPRSASCDMESLSGRSRRSRDNGRTKRSKSGGGSICSRSSRHSRPSHISIASEAKSELSIITPRTLAHDLERLEKQLAMLRTEVGRTKVARMETPSSPLTISTGGFSSYTTVPLPRVSAKHRVVVVVPPGKLGVILANRRDGIGTVVAEVKNSSALKGALTPGDKLVAIDGVDVTGMVVAEITSMMAAKSSQERHLTVITSSKVKPLSQEMKYSSP
jgi:hypothetical protein